MHLLRYQPQISELPGPEVVQAAVKFEEVVVDQQV